ncbi:geranylgeranyl reductase family protein [Micromonospora sp. RTP1Z1]|uniref:NAD(P)/FAD-dependent oxidoreductase n=1 Tax=Micromonospora sp. RTP1Z1 TaxID=2994043 RepID=UPI0029C8B774|nr:geranylgeranyl reductase family protein [Micromonospora sp. RTP1Z1]
MRRHDAIVVGAGPAGSIAALVLARAGVDVALVDRRRFPREKACGDLVGPRGVHLLDELGVSVTGARPLQDMIVVAPNNRRVLLPALPGSNYADHAIAVTREQFDTRLFDMAVAAGAIPVQRRVTGLVYDQGVVDGVQVSGGATIRGDVVLGADGATSSVAHSAGLADSAKALWGFALRGYLDDDMDLPHIVLWEPRRWRLFPGYGWAFPMAGGGVNVGLGLAFGSDRVASRHAGEQLDNFLAHLERLGLLPRSKPRSLTGGWLKMGVLGTTPAANGVLLVGDAAGLVNPLQGEGIAQAMASGHAAANAILQAGPRCAGRHYLAYLHGAIRHHRTNVPVHAGMVKHPLALALTARALSAPGIGAAIAGAWGLYWNDLAHDALPSRHRRLATAASRTIAAAGRRGDAAHWFTAQFTTADPRPAEAH